MQVFSSAPGQSRTGDARLRSPALYPLSYEGGDAAGPDYLGRGVVVTARVALVIDNPPQGRVEPLGAAEVVEVFE
jgi:hypothetical protein